MDKIFGFGMMRLPMINDEVNYDEVNDMVDLFIKEGFNYFDTAHGYLNGKSEIAVNKCLASRYDRDKYILTNKLTGDYFEKEEDIIPFCKKQLEICGVEYFDYYLMHAQSRGNYDHFKKCHAYETAFKLKEMGLVKHVGLSFHDSPEFLDKILNEYPDVEVVQIQFNYLDYDNPNVQSKGVYDVCRKHNKPILVMEPVKGGTLANLPLDAKKIVDSLNVSPASLAIRYAASFEGMIRVLSGMSSLEQMKDNISFMKEFKKIDKNEEKVISKVVEKLKDTNSIPCTGCAYCTNNCPIGVPIPEIFKLYNSKKLYNNWGVKEKYEELIKSKCDPKDCLHCGACESACPQKLEIRELLEKVSKEFE